MGDKRLPGSRDPQSLQETGQQEKRRQTTLKKHAKLTLQRGTPFEPSSPERDHVFSNRKSCSTEGERIGNHAFQHPTAALVTPTPQLGESKKAEVTHPPRHNQVPGNPFQAERSLGRRGPSLRTRRTRSRGEPPAGKDRRGNSCTDPAASPAPQVGSCRIAGGKRHTAPATSTRPSRARDAGPGRQKLPHRFLRLASVPQEQEHC
ncbi:hypothetical protein NDU88_005189 [Pleurodeles waltl]|uniref:Uncharacterized protein n=1 Tax=Pleurodeles waltl TaxID=8319 RepID=A0AAV7MIM9_PLEWA|nr:hypothetical protein NDU88_005189 [Pleurodeles waltl]